MATRLFTGQSRLRPKISDITGARGKVVSDAGHPLGDIGLTIGGVIPSYAPGHDSMLAELSPDECVLVPEAVRVLAGAAINSLFDAGSASGSTSVVPADLPGLAEQARRLRRSSGTSSIGLVLADLYGPLGGETEEFGMRRDRLGGLIHEYMPRSHEATGFSAPTSYGTRSCPSSARTMSAWRTSATWAARPEAPLCSPCVLPPR